MNFFKLDCKFNNNIAQNSITKQVLILKRKNVSLSVSL